MKSLEHLIAAAVLVSVAMTTSVFAADAPKTEKAQPYPLSFCVVSDEKFEGSSMKPAELVYEGQTMKFCCKDCVKDFNKDPKKLAAKFADEAKKLEAAKKK